MDVWDEARRDVAGGGCGGGGGGEGVWCMKRGADGAVRDGGAEQW